MLNRKRVRENSLENQPEWGVKTALICYVTLFGGILIGSLIVALALLGMKIDYLNSPFPIALISMPVNEAIIFGVTLLFAGYKRESLRKLGLKKVNLRILTIVSVAALLLFLLAVAISIGEEAVFGPDPMTDLLEKSMAPRDLFQLVAMIAFSLVLVGPCEELAFRGFVQRGFENSVGRMKGLLIASVLFALLHGLNSLYAIIPVFAISLVLGYLWQRTGGNTTASALTHGMYNSILLAVAYFWAV